MAPLDAFTQKRLIIAEGWEDAVVARELITKRVRTDFDIQTTEDLGGAPGYTGFYDAILGANGKHGFDVYQHVVILADNDHHGHTNKRFTEIRDSIEKLRAEGLLKRSWGKPINPCIPANGDPTVTIWMWPKSGENGYLETLLWSIVCAQRGNAAKIDCVEKFIKCASATSWSQVDKARVRAFLSIGNKNKPDIRYDKLWRQYPDLIPLDHRLFKPLADFLKTL